MEKSFGDIVAKSVDVFKKSFLPNLGILGIFYGIIVFCGIIAGIMGVKAIPQILQNLKDPLFLQEFLQAFIVPIIVVFALIAILFSFSSIWQILVIRNNAIIGKTFFKESFFEAVRKFVKVLFLGLLMLIIFVALGFISAIILGKYSWIILTPFSILCAPLMFTTYYAILCKEDKFWEIILDAISLGFSKWFKIMGFSILFGICFGIIFFVVIFVVSSLFNSINMPVVGNIFNFLFQIIMPIFLTCFYTVFYLDLAGIGKQNEEIENIETIESPLLEQNNNTVENIAPQPVEENKNSGMEQLK